MVTMTAKADTREMRRKVDRLLRNAVFAEREFVREQCRDTAAKVAELSAPFVDTGRFVRSWQQAANDLGASLPLQPLRPSRMADKFRPILQRQADFAAARRRFWVTVLTKSKNKAARLLEDSGKSVFSREAERRMRRARAALERWGNYEDAALAQLEAIDSNPGEALILIGGKKTKSASAKGRLSTIRAKVYGGAGEVFRANGRWFARARSMEPHAQFVERGFLRYSTGPDGTANANVIEGRRVVKRALTMMKAQGVSPASKRAYTERLSSGVRVSAAAGGRR
jgi:hypothetical protein